MITFKQLIPLSIALSGLFACASAGRQAAWEKPVAAPGAATSTSSTSTATTSAHMADGNAAWAKRDDKAQTEAAIAAWEKAVAENPSNADALTRLARAHYFYVTAHVGLDGSADKDARKALYQKGVDYGEKALLLVEPDFGKAMAAGGDFMEEISKIGKAGIPAAYWYCTNLGRFSVESGVTVKLFYKDRVAAAMKRIHELDSSFFYTAADRYFCAFYSALPGIAGKDVKRSAKHCAAALAGGPGYLSNHLTKATFLAAELDDEDMYKKLMAEILAGSDTEDPNMAPENRGAKRAAKQLLENIDDVF
jgi:hypothetical protein